MKKAKILLIILSMILVLTTFVSAHTGEDDYNHHSMMGSMIYGSYGQIGMWFGWALGLLILIILVLFIIWLIKQIQKK